MALFPCPIPKITDKLGDTWVQPSHSEIKFSSDGYAVITQDGVDQLVEYSTSIPSGVYAGKMWKRKDRFSDDEYLCWFQNSPSEPYCCEVKYRKILLQEVFDLINPSGQGNE